MGLTPADITNTTFTHSRRGYDIAEVDRFLRALADKVAAEPPEQFGQIGDEVASVLRAANETASSIRTRAETETEQAFAEAERIKAENETRRAEAEAEVKRSLAEAEGYAAETRAAADAYALETRSEADQYAALTRQVADDHDQAVRREADEYADGVRAGALEEARTIRAQAEDDAQRRSAALVAAATEKVDELEGVENEIRRRVQSMAIDIQRLADVGNGVIDIRERRRSEDDEDTDGEDTVPASRAVWTAVGDAMAGTETPSQQSSVS